MRRLIAIVIANLCLSVWLTSYAQAAAVTDMPVWGTMHSVGTGQTRRHRDIFVETSLQMQFAQGNIAREQSFVENNPNAACVQNNPGACGPRDELSYVRQRYIQNIHASMGLWKNLSLSVDLPILLHEQTDFSYASGIDKNNSTVDNAIGAIFPNDLSTYHRGLMGFVVGLRYAPLQNTRNDNHPSLVLSAQWFAPYGSKTWDPSQSFSRDNPGGAGNGMHEVTFGIAISKRLPAFHPLMKEDIVARRGMLEPYLQIRYTLPIADKSMALDALDTSKEFGKRPSQRGTMRAGLEIIPIEDVHNRTKLAFDVAFLGTYFSEGRNYDILTDALRKPTFTQNHMRVGAALGTTWQMHRLVRLQVNVGASYDVPYWLTLEAAGRDVNGDNQILKNDDRLNPYYCGNTADDACSKSGQYADLIGHRFRANGAVIVDVNANLAVTF